MVSGVPCWADDPLSHPTAAVPFLLCELGLVPPVRRGFYCNDSSIRYPLTAAETVSDGALVSIGLLLSATTVSPSAPLLDPPPNRPAQCPQRHPLSSVSQSWHCTQVPFSQPKKGLALQIPSVRGMRGVEGSVGLLGGYKSKGSLLSAPHISLPPSPNRLPWVRATGCGARASAPRPMHRHCTKSLAPSSLAAPWASP